MSRGTQPHARGLLALARLVAKLKTVRRTGWRDRGIPESRVESVADHSLAVALLAWACATERRQGDDDLDPARVALLALVHDLPEAETGDVPPYDAETLSAHAQGAERRAFLDRRHSRDPARLRAKREREDAAMRQLLGSLPPAARSALRDLWIELREGASAEARFVKDVDRLETFLQSRFYLAASPEAPMESFRREVAETLADPLLAAIRDEALRDGSQP